MHLPELVPELIDHIFAALLDVIGPQKILRLRVVNQFFNDTILRAVTDIYVRFRHGPFHNWLDKWIFEGPESRDWYTWKHCRRVSPPMMGRFMEAQIQSELVQFPLSALRDVLKTMDEISPVVTSARLERARQVYEAAADYLDWDVDHKFALSWPGDLPRKLSPCVDEMQQTLFAAAVVAGNLSIIRNLLQDTAIDVNYESPFFGRSLQLAARRGDAAILELLLAHGADPLATQVHRNQIDPADQYPSKVWGVFYSSHGSALQVACLAGNICIVRALLGLPVKLPSEHCKLALSSASRGGNVRVLEVLLESLPGLEKSWQKLVFLTACRQGRLEVVNMMLCLGVQPDIEAGKIQSYTYTGLQFAALRGHASIVRLLLESLPNISGNYYSLLFNIRRPMENALRYGHIGCIRALFEFGGFTDYDWAFPLIRRAVHAPHLASVRLLVRLGLDLNLLGPGIDISIGEVALLDAVEKGRDSVVRVLLELGVSPNSVRQERHPVLTAKVYGEVEILKTLLEFGGDNIGVSDSVYAADLEAGKTPYLQKGGVYRFGAEYPEEWRGRDF